MYIENLHLRQKAVLIIRLTMSKLKFKYGIKPKWIEELKKIVRKGEIPSIANHNLSLNVLHGRNLTPLVLREDSNKLKYTNQTLDEYVIDDISDNPELITNVSMMSSDGFLKYVLDDENSIDYDHVQDGRLKEIGLVKIYPILPKYTVLKALPYLSSPIQLIFLYLLYKYPHTNQTIFIDKILFRKRLRINFSRTI